MVESNETREEALESEKLEEREREGGREMSLMDEGCGAPRPSGARFKGDGREGRDSLLRG